MPTTLAKLSPVQWRVLVRLFNTDADLRVGPLKNRQDASWAELVAMEADSLVFAWLGDMPIRMADMVNPTGSALVGLRIHLLDAGRNLLVRSKFINVICVLAVQPGRAMQVRKLKPEADATDHTLRVMADDGLISVLGDPDLDLASFKTIPGDLRVKLTPKGRQYYPN